MYVICVKSNLTTPLTSETPLFKIIYAVDDVT